MSGGPKSYYSRRTRSSGYTITVSPHEKTPPILSPPLGRILHPQTTYDLTDYSKNTSISFVQLYPTNCLPDGTSNMTLKLMMQLQSTLACTHYHLSNSKNK